MFGLMRPEKTKSCKTDGNYRRQRMHYCGTCKTLGVEYGQRARAVLNFDAVFFAEMLSQLSKENLSDWQEGYQAINRCFTMPEQEQGSPLSLQYAAATNVLLSELKTDDNIKDLSAFKWKFFRHFFSAPFHKAQQKLDAWGLDNSLLWEQIKKQEALEKDARKSFTSVEKALVHYAAPSATITALVFEQGAKVIGQESLAEAMYQLGYQFGELVYMLDAFEDYEEDLFQKQFNPLFSKFDADGIDTPLKAEILLSKTAQIILAKQEFISQQLQKLPLREGIIEEYSVRLFSNVTLKLQKERKSPISFKESVMSTWSDFTNQTIQQATWATSNLRQANYYLVSLIIFVIPLVVETASVGEGDSQVIYKWMAGFTSLLGSIGFVRFLIRREKRKTKRKKRSFKRRVLRRIKMAQRKMKRFFRRAKKRLSSKRPCWADCGTICLEVCFEEACYSSCDCIVAALEDGRVWPWVVLVLLAFLITIAVLGLI